MGADSTQITKTSAEITKDAATRYVTHNVPLGDLVVEVGKLHLPKGQEAQRCQEIMNIFVEYAIRSKVSCPLSIAVFGPPGSGKSHGVKAILKSLNEHYQPLELINLSQFSGPENLTEAFMKAINPRKDTEKDGMAGKVVNPQNAVEKDERAKVFFFDEFDTALGGVSLGWLRWFLGPMQDGEFLYEGVPVKIGKALFIFAGGTAASLADFVEKARLNEAEYTHKKVPDFVSRLRGFIDIQGINSLDDERPTRRALVLRHLIKERWPEHDKDELPIDHRLVESLLSNAYYVHGVRSMQALLDMCRFGDAKILSTDQLPADSLRRLHLSRGELDEKVVGISAGIKEDAAKRMLRALTDGLLRNGATLAYGGDFIPDGTLESLIDVARELPDDLVHRTDQRIRNYVGFPSFLKDGVEEQYKPLQDSVQFLRLDTLSKSELEGFRVPGGGNEWFRARPESGAGRNWRHHLAWAVSLFRMRVRLLQDACALIVVGGKSEGSWGRFSGIAEEVVLMIAMDKPVYVLGGLPGAARDVGYLLGLGKTLVNPDGCLADEGEIAPSARRPEFASSFTLPGHPNLPGTVPEVRAYLLEHSISTSLWCWNGLTPDQNRTLFQTDIGSHNWGQIVDLILLGLSRLNWRLSGDRAQGRGDETANPVR